MNRTWDSAGTQVVAGVLALTCRYSRREPRHCQSPTEPRRLGRATPLPKPDRAVSALDAVPKAGLLVSRIDNRFDVMLLKAPMRRQQSGIRVAEPNRYLTGKGKSS